MAKVGCLIPLYPHPSQTTPPIFPSSTCVIQSVVPGGILELFLILPSLSVLTSNLLTLLVPSPKYISNPPIHHLHSHYLLFTRHSYNSLLHSLLLPPPCLQYAVYTLLIVTQNANPLTFLLCFRKLFCNFPLEQSKLKTPYTSVTWSVLPGCDMKSTKSKSKHLEAFTLIWKCCDMYTCDQWTCFVVQIQIDQCVWHKSHTELYLTQYAYQFCTIESC